MYVESVKRILIKYIGKFAGIASDVKDKMISTKRDSREYEELKIEYVYMLSIVEIFDEMLYSLTSNKTFFNALYINFMIIRVAKKTKKLLKKDLEELI